MKASLARRVVVVGAGPGGLCPAYPEKLIWETVLLVVTGGQAMDVMRRSDYLPSDEEIVMKKTIYLQGFPVHSHEFLEIVYIARGSGTHHINEHQYEVTAGDVFFLNHSSKHTLELEIACRGIQTAGCPCLIGTGRCRIAVAGEKKDIRFAS